MKRHAPTNNFQKLTFSIDRGQNAVLEAAMRSSGLTKSELLRLILAKFLDEGGQLRIDLSRTP